MFSDYLRKLDEAPCKVLLGVAAGLVILCQLVAMALVVDAQVDRAQARSVQYASERSALAQCNGSSLGTTARKNCVLQAQAAANPFQGTGNMPDMQAVADATVLEHAPLLSLQAPGLMPALFTAR